MVRFDPMQYYMNMAGSKKISMHGWFTRLVLMVLEKSLRGGEVKRSSGRRMVLN
jgi:hypothetical protein